MVLAPGWGQCLQRQGRDPGVKLQSGSVLPRPGPAFRATARGDRKPGNPSLGVVFGPWLPASPHPSTALCGWHFPRGRRDACSPLASFEILSWNAKNARQEPAACARLEPGGQAVLLRSGQGPRAPGAREHQDCPRSQCASPRGARAPSPRGFFLGGWRGSVFKAGESQ